jgi:hypothetical protein
MPFALVSIGLLMIITGAKGTYACFGKDIAEDFTGKGNFTFWLVSIGAVGSLGYIEKLRPLSQAFMTLVIIVMLLSNKGFFAQFMSAIQNGPVKSDCKTGSSGGDAATGNISFNFNDALDSMNSSNSADLAGIQQTGTDRIASAGKTLTDIVSIAMKFVVPV